METAWAPSAAQGDVGLPEGIQQRLGGKYPGEQGAVQAEATSAQDATAQV